jgi:hypothetical protein
MVSQREDCIVCVAQTMIEIILSTRARSRTADDVPGPPDLTAEMNWAAESPELEF